METLIAIVTLGIIVFFVRKTLVGNKKTNTQVSGGGYTESTGDSTSGRSNEE